LYKYADTQKDWVFRGTLYIVQVLYIQQCLHVVNSVKDYRRKSCSRIHRSWL